MSRKLTTEEYIAQARAIHGDTYIYDNVKYVRANQKIEIGCRVEGHGSFMVQAQDHKTNKTGCPKCARIRTVAGKALTQEKFLERAKAAHGDRYEYSETFFVRVNEHVNIRCKKHGLFSQTPHSHMDGSGCTLCANEENSKRQRSNTEEFIAKAKLIHGNKYNYDYVDYISNTTEVKIFCNTHKEFFWQEPSNHLQGAGCPECGKSGFNRNKPASLYILRCDNMTKVGITNVAVTKRLKQLSGSSKHDYTIFHSQYFESGENALNLETKTLQYLKALYKQPEDKFQGSTECFFDVNIEELMQFVSPQSNIPELT